MYRGQPPNGKLFNLTPDFTKSMQTGYPAEIKFSKMHWVPAAAAAAESDDKSIKKFLKIREKNAKFFAKLKVKQTDGGWEATAKTDVVPLHVTRTNDGLVADDQRLSALTYKSSNSSLDCEVVAKIPYVKPGPGAKGKQQEKGRMFNQGRKFKLGSFPKAED